MATVLVLIWKLLIRRLWGDSGLHWADVGRVSRGRRLLRETFEPEKLTRGTQLASAAAAQVVEVGPRMNFSTALSANAVSICQSCGLSQVSCATWRRNATYSGGAARVRGRFESVGRSRRSQGTP